MKFRILTDTHYEMPDEILEKSYGTDDPTEAAQNMQADLRNDGSALFEMMAEEDTETQIYVQVFDPGGQMFTDEFIREVIGIVRLQDFEMYITDNPEKRQAVHARLVGYEPNLRQTITLDGYGRTMGFALRDIREQLRNMTGK